MTTGNLPSFLQSSAVEQVLDIPLLYLHIFFLQLFATKNLLKFGCV